MKTPLFLCLSGLLLATPAIADQSKSYPKEKPAIDFTLPDDWEVQSKEGAFFASPKDDDSFFLSLAPLESKSDDPEAAIKEVKAAVAEGFKNLTYEELQKVEGNGVAILLLQAKGEDEDGKANITSIMINQPDSEHLLYMQFVSSKEGFDKHGDAGLKIIRSIKAHLGGKEAEEETPAEAEEGETQTYNYPDKDKPAFSLSVPADWKIESDDKGAHIVSADKMFTTTVIVVDAEHADDATESIKKDVGARYDSITWEDPTEHKDPASDMTMTANEGIADGKGVNYKVGVLKLTKKDAKKVFILNTWAPEKAIEGNGEAIMKMLTSIKLH